MAALSFSVAAGAGCAGYESTSAPLRKALDAGRKDAAVKQLNTALGVTAEGQGKFADSADAPLVLLERATVLMATGSHDLSARDFQAADADMEVLDLDSDTAGSIGKYLWSDSATNYRPPAYEKSLINSLNLLNYLARGMLSGARVEARRLTISERYLADHEEGKGLVALGSYLAGFTFERSGRWDQAMRYYADAKERGGLPTLDDAIARLHAKTGAWDKRMGPPPAPADGGGGAGGPGGPDSTGELLVVVGTGRAPYKMPQRVPIGLAIAYLTTPHCAPHCLSPAQRKQANMVVAKGLTTWLNYPEMRRVRAGVTGATVRLDSGDVLPGGQALDVEAAALKVFDRAKGLLYMASFTRAIARALAGGATQAVVNAANSDKGGGLPGFLAGLLVEGIMVAQDVPDTRSWSSLPGRLHVFRVRVPPGAHQVRIALSGAAGGGEVVRQVDVRPGGYTVVTHLTLR